MQTTASVPPLPAFARFRPLAIVGALASASTIVVLRLAMGSGNAGTLFTWFTAWALAPSLLVLALGLTVPARAQSWAYCVIVGFPAAMGPVAYVMAHLGPPDAQGGLLFLFMPFWQLLALPVAIFIGFFVVRRRLRAADAAADARDAEIEAMESNR